MTAQPYRSLLLACILGCGGSANAPEPEAAAGTSGREREAADSRDELAVTGLLGTLSQSEIQNTLEPRMLKFSRCVQRRSGAVEWLSGEVEFSFHIALDGSVAAVFPSASTMGDRDTERCMLDLARSLRFPKPHGGEADFRWPLDVPLDPDVREPVEWDAAQASEVLSKNAVPALEACGGGAFAITAYVDPEGRVVAAGASVADPNDDTKVDCITDAIKSWVFPSPGSYAAKISFGLR